MEGNLAPIHSGDGGLWSQMHDVAVLKGFTVLLPLACLCAAYDPDLIPGIETSDDVIEFYGKFGQDRCAPCIAAYLHPACPAKHVPPMAAALSSSSTATAHADRCASAPTTCWWCHAKRWQRLSALQALMAINLRPTFAALAYRWTASTSH